MNQAAIDERIKNVKLLFIAIAAFVAVYISVSIPVYRKGEDLYRIEVLDMVNALISIESESIASVSLDGAYATNFVREDSKYVAEAVQGEVTVNSLADEFSWPDGSGTLFKNVPVRTSRDKVCEVATINVTPAEGGNFTIVTPGLFGQPKKEVASELEIVAFDECAGWPSHGLPFLRMKQENGETGYLINGAYFRSLFPDMIDTTTDAFALRFTDIKPFLPGGFAKHLDDEIMYYYATKNSLVGSVLNIASERTGIIFDANDLDIAIDEASNFGGDAVSWQGVSATPVDFIRYAPLLLIFLLWEQWRLVRRLPNHLTSVIYFMPSDCDDGIGFIGSVIYSLFPLLASATVFYIYCDSLGFYLYTNLAFDVHLPNFSDTNRLPVISGYEGGDWYSKMLLQISVVGCLFVLPGTTGKLIAISWNSLVVSFDTGEAGREWEEVLVLMRKVQDRFRRR